MKKPVAFMVAGLLVFILYLHVFVGFAEIAGILQRVNPTQYLAYYSLTVAAIVLSVLFHSMVWHELLKALSVNIGLKKAFLFSWIGNFVDLVVPLEAVSGEVTRGYLVHNYLKCRFGETIASLVLQRIISVLTVLTGLVASSVYVILRYRVEPAILYLLVAVAGGTAAMIMGLLYLSLKEEAARKLVNVLIGVAGVITRNRSKLAELRRKAEQALGAFHQGVKTYGRSPKYLVKPLAYSYVSWFFYMTIYFLVFYALGFEEAAVYIPQMIVVFSISLAVQTMPLAFPVGLVEIVMTSLYVVFGIPTATSGVATTLIRVVTFWFQILVGYAVVQWVGIKHVLSRNNKTESLNQGAGSR